MYQIIALCFLFLGYIANDNDNDNNNDNNNNNNSTFELLGIKEREYI